MCWGAKFSPGLVLDNAVWNSHLPAEGWQEHHQLRKDQMLSNFPTTNDINKDFSVFFRRQSSSFNSVEEVTVYIMREYSTISRSINLNGVNIVGDDHKLSLLLLNKSGHGVDSVADDSGTLGGGVLLASGPEQTE